jgi:hypothetical protein
LRLLIAGCIDNGENLVGYRHPFSTPSDTAFATSMMRADWYCGGGECRRWSPSTSSNPEPYQLSLPQRAD